MLGSEIDAARKQVYPSPNISLKREEKTSSRSERRLDDPFMMIFQAGVEVVE